VFGAQSRWVTWRTWRRRALSSLLGLVSCLAFGGTARAAEPGSKRGAAPHDAARFVTRDRNEVVRWVLIGSGVALLTPTYGLPCAVGHGVWCVPVAGPFWALGRRIKQDKRDDAASGSNAEGPPVPPIFVYTMMAGLGAAQLGSVLLVVAGASVPRREERVRIQGITLVPTLTANSVGLAAVGTL
jgi:hypothetical protein